MFSLRHKTASTHPSPTACHPHSQLPLWLQPICRDGGTQWPGACASLTQRAAGTTEAGATPERGHPHARSTSPSPFPLRSPTTNSMFLHTAAPHTPPAAGWETQSPKHSKPPSRTTEANMGTSDYKLTCGTWHDAIKNRDQEEGCRLGILCSRVPSMTSNQVHSSVV